MVHPGERAAGPEQLFADDSAGDLAVDDERLASAQTRVGRTLRSKWRLDGLLAVGGMAAVYAATHRNGQRAAVKILHPDMSAHAMVRERFLREGYVANAVAHPGAVQVIDDDTAEDGSLFLVTELLDGDTLEQCCRRLGGRLPEREALVVVDRVLDVLASAHGRGIIHRDVKPDNVFLTRSGQVKLLDFGIARLQQVSPRKRLTQTGLVMGTPAYMAPELASGHADQVDQRTDLWACGAMVYRVMTGDDVHAGGTLQEQLVSAMTRPARRLASVLPNVSPPVAELVDRALAFDKSLRWADAQAMQQALRRAYERVAGAPIDLAPPLVVGVTVRNGPTVRPDSRVASLPTAPGFRTLEDSGPDPIERQRVPTIDDIHATAIRLRIAPWPPRRWWLVAGGATVLLGLAIGWAVSRATPTTGPRPAGLAAQPAPRPRASVGAADAPPAATLGPLPEPPLVSVSDLPEARRDDKKTGATAGSSSSAANKGDCHPPYVVDGQTGKKRWKLECL
jgi:serine/threonine-protein kinase